MYDRTMKQNYFPEVTIAKGIGIALVVIGHCVPDALCIKQFIYLFHMPLFFFLSGYCYRINSDEKMTNYILRKVKSLYVPFVVCNGFALLFHQLFCKIGVYPKEDLFQSVGQFVRNLIKILLCIKMEDVVAPLWFLPILMLVNVGYALLRKIALQAKFSQVFIHILVFVVYLGGFIVPRTGLFRAYVLSSLGLFSYDLGFLFKKYRIIDKMGNWIVVIFTAVLLVASKFYDLNMIQMQIGSPIEYAMLSIMGICVVLKLSGALAQYNNIHLLYYIGENSIVILELHYYVFILISIIQKYIITGTIHNGINSFVQYYSSSSLYRFCWFIIYFLFGIGIPLVINRIMQGLKYKKGKMR